MRDGTYVHHIPAVEPQGTEIYDNTLYIDMMALYC
jgi:hypothetical protein